MKPTFNDEDGTDMDNAEDIHDKGTAIHRTLPSIWFSKRFLVTFLIFLGLINMSLLKGNVGIAIVEMTSDKPLTEGNLTIIRPAEFNWPTTTIGLILNVYEYGGLFSFLCSSAQSKLGGSTTYGTVMLLMSILTILAPICIEHNFLLFLAIRFLTGFLDNISYASRSEIFSRWIPTNERSRLMSFSFNGIYLGSGFMHVFCGILAHNWGWRMTFYVTGLINVVWSLIWFILVPNDPSKDKLISRKERSYIIRNIEKITPSNQVAVPYISIFTSKPFWVMCFCRVSVSWISSLVVSCLPLYIKDITHKTTDYVGMVSSIPSIVCVLIIPFVGIMMDYLKSNLGIGTTNIHKGIMVFDYMLSAALFILVICVSNFFVSVAAFTIIRTLTSISSLVSLLVTIHMAPNHTGVISALSQFWYSVGNIGCQLCVGFMTTNHSLQEWNELFAVTTCLTILSGVLFTIYGSSEPQPWSKDLLHQDQHEEVSMTNPHNETS